MKLKCVSTPPLHKQTVTAVTWTPSNQIYAASDDKSISVWNVNGEIVNKCLVKLDEYVTDIDWLPQVGTQVASQFVISCTSGRFFILSQSGRVEKVSNTKHHGAIISIQWNNEGNAVATAGEDGSVKIHSSTGMLRSTLSRSKTPVYALAWSPNSDRLLYSQGRDLVIRSLKVDNKKTEWKAHDGFVMKVDWNPVNNKIVSCGEDCKYKVWDSYGRMLYQSETHEHVITSVRWNPGGNVFAVGSFNMLRLCDETGWSYNRDKPESGSLFGIAWSADGTNVAGAGGNGTVVLAQLVERRLSWKEINVELVRSPGEQGNQIRVIDVGKETAETLDFRERVVEMSLGYGHLAVVTATQCYLYNVHNWNTPHMFDLRYPVSFIKQSDRFFVMLNNMNGVQVHNYEGRHLCAPTFPGLRVECLSDRTMSIAVDVLAILNRMQPTKIHVFNIIGGRPIGTIEHSSQIIEIDVSRYSKSETRIVSFIDVNRDLYISLADGRNRPAKIATMVDTSEWNDASDMLTAVADGKLVTWIFPHAIYIDRDLLELGRMSRDSGVFGKNPYITGFYGPRITIRRADGALVTTSVSPYPPMLYNFVASARWEEAVRLCRFVKRQELWAALAAMSLHGRHLDTAEIALAAISEIDKLQYILYIKDIPSDEGRAAELALYKQKPNEAERILMQAAPPLVYRAIKMNIRLFRWERALELAVKNQTHVDTVLAYRQRFLQQNGRKETNVKFIQLEGKVEIDWDAIKKKKAAEKEKESRRAGRG